MFTGIIQSTGIVTFINKKKNIFIIKTNLNLDNCNIGSSICCDGVCLTIINIIKIDKLYEFEVNVGEETLKRSNLIFWKKNTKINIEKSLRMGDEISGHFVYGHVDLLLSVTKIQKLKNSWEFNFSFSTLLIPINFTKFIVEKGSIAINGISLTIANIYDNHFSVSVIPHTFNNTNLSILKEDDYVNIEFDPLARYINKQYEK